MHPQCFLALLAVAARSDSSAGTWQPLENLKSQHVQEIAKFAVDEFKKQSGKDLKLEKVVKGETQIVSGTDYRVVIEVEKGTKWERYPAVVYEKPWEHHKQLTSFKPVH